jgi:uncharacterized protein YbbC (DUF1343 family)
MNDNPFQYGIDTLLRDHPDWLRGRRIGLVAHAASVGTQGAHSALLLRESGHALSCLFGPEHGFKGKRGAGESVQDETHPEYHIPVYSLYGDARKPTSEMLREVDTMVFDLQDLGVRCYTYVSTLRYVLEAAAENGKSVVVADRPVPLANTVDGPMLDEPLESFVGCVPAPLVYGMTPAETAKWLVRELRLSVDLQVAPMKGYRRESSRPKSWPAWIPPSPGIRSWDSGICYPITVLYEALPAFDHGRRTGRPFQLVGSPWMNSQIVCDALDEAKWTGVRFIPAAYQAMGGRHKGQRVEGFRIKVTQPDAFRPVEIGIGIVRVLQDLYGSGWIWSQPGTRSDFFDLLLGTASCREALQEEHSPAAIAASWSRRTAEFRSSRESCLLYTR